MSERKNDNLKSLYVNDLPHFLLAFMCEADRFLDCQLEDVTIVAQFAMRQELFFLLPKSYWV